ncbi:MAG: alpha/beta fold hydrolase [Myxococcales bacterium]|jgi:alpha-beta hydrolase superfamily lysophospholipase|nr:alpha/beta fold hydrolase [Myxococcales bacterium]
MKKTFAALGFGSLLVGLGAVSGACSSSDTPGSSSGSSADGGSDAPAAAAFDLAVACADSIDAVYGDPGALPADKGAIIKCAKDKDIPKADLEAAAKAEEGYEGKPFTSGAKTFRILYRTERGNGKAGYSSAIVYVPDTPRTKADLPVVVASHGSRGQAAKCAPSKQDPAASAVEGDYHHQVYPLVGAGYAVIAPDLAGYANYGAADNPPSSYADADDVGKSTLDGARALKKLFKAGLSNKVVITGHSQGGGTALAALGISDAYGFDMPIAGVAVYAPLWLPGRTNQAVLADPATYPFSSGAVPKVVTWFLYTQGELRDGPGKGAEIFKADKRDGIKKFVDETCWAADYPLLNSLGKDLGDVVDPAFAKSVGVLANCPASDALCTKWQARFDAVRPHISGNAGKVPILTIGGDKDPSITPAYQACVNDRLRNDKANYKYCYVPGANHNNVVSKRAAHVNDWIGNLTLGEPAPTGCELGEADLKDGTGQQQKCDALINAFNEY